MALSQKHEAQLLKIAAALQEIVTTAKDIPAGANVSQYPLTRTRRVGKELVEFRKLLKKERKAGVPVAELAAKHGVTSSYIYQLRD